MVTYCDGFRGCCSCRPDDDDDDGCRRVNVFIQATNDRRRADGLYAARGSLVYDKWI